MYRLEIGNDNNVFTKPRYDVSKGTIEGRATEQNRKQHVSAVDARVPSGSTAESNLAVMGPPVSALGGQNFENCKEEKRKVS